MQRNHILLVALTLFVVLVGAACAPAGAGAVKAASESANQAEAPQQPVAVSANQPADSGQPAAAAPTEPAASPQLVPICQSPTTCTAPVATQYEIGCVEKMPYTNVVVAPDTAFEVLDKTGSFKCSDSGYVVDGKTVLSCYGKELYTFDLKLSGADCGGAALTTGTDQCQDGYGYDAAQKCCAPVSGVTSGSATVQVNLGACPLPRHRPGGWSRPQPQ